MLRFTEAELAEMAAADAEIDRAPLTEEEYRLSATLDREARLQRMDNQHRSIAARQKAYREANREKYNNYMREYMRRRRLEKKYAQTHEGPADSAGRQAGGA